MAVLARTTPTTHQAHHSAAYRRKKIGKEVGFWALLSVFGASVVMWYFMGAPLARRFGAVVMMFRVGA